MNNHKHHITPVPARDAATGVCLAVVAAIALIGALTGLASLTSTAEAQGGGGVGGDGGGGGESDGGKGADPGAGPSGHPYVFPVPAKHTYGDGYGAGRGHQGQDVFARCGSKLVAARAGRVQHRASHSAAGNYVVIDGDGTGVDLMYAHLQRKAPVKVGERVQQGQVIGQVGDTGNATGCHLHFEMWSAPGWHEGGSPMRSVTKKLKQWDRYS